MKGFSLKNKVSGGGERARWVKWDLLMHSGQRLGP